MISKFKLFENENQLWKEDEFEIDYNIDNYHPFIINKGSKKSCSVFSIIEINKIINKIINYGKFLEEDVFPSKDKNCISFFLGKGTSINDELTIYRDNDEYYYVQIYDWDVDRYKRKYKCDTIQGLNNLLEVIFIKYSLEKNDPEIKKLKDNISRWVSKNDDVEKLRKMNDIIRL